MDGAAAAFVAGVQRGQEVDYFGTADLAYYQTIWAHAEGLADQVSEGDFAGAFDIGRARFQADYVWVVGTEFARVFDQDQALGRVGQGEQGVEQGRLAGAGAATDEERQAGIEQVAEYRRTGLAGVRRRLTRSSRVKTWREGTRRDRQVPGAATGASTAWKRVPSERRTSTYGVASSSRRPAAAARRVARRRMAGSSPVRTATRSRPWPRSM